MIARMVEITQQMHPPFSIFIPKESESCLKVKVKICLIFLNLYTPVSPEMLLLLAVCQTVFNV